MSANCPKCEELQRERDWLLDELVKDSATLIHSLETNSKSFEECLNETRFFIEEHLRTLHAK